LPAQQGAFSSFWLTPSDGSWPPEIDIIEVAANDPYTIYSSIHYVNSGQTIGTPVGSMSDAFHTYGLSWTPDKITWYF
ncbi:family 16 glycosylhydrolase, partial [Roseomonas sp. NAR14]